MKLIDKILNKFGYYKLPKQHLQPIEEILPVTLESKISVHPFHPNLNKYQEIVQEDLAVDLGKKAIPFIHFDWDENRETGHDIITATLIIIPANK